MTLIEINHVSRYTYDAPVSLDPHVVRLCPRSQGGARLAGYSLDVFPIPAGIAPGLDADGNTFHQVWFSGSTTRAEYTVRARIELTELNPLEFLLLPVLNTRLPLEYSPQEKRDLARYLERPDPSLSAASMAEDVAANYRSDAVSALLILTQRIHEHCHRVHREDGPPYSPEETYQHREGACRDLAMLMIDACRAIGLPSRFVSGYALAELAVGDHELHAWVEVYLPGAGWRAFDPSQGTIAAERHLAVAAAAAPESCAPIQGSYRSQGAASALSYNVSVAQSNLAV